MHPPVVTSMFGCSSANSHRAFSARVLEALYTVKGLAVALRAASRVAEFQSTYDGNASNSNHQLSYDDELTVF